MDISSDGSVAALDAGEKQLGPGEGYDFSDLEDECGLDTGYPGDILCMKPPAAADGFQIHLGPSDYDDAKEVEKYLLQPGEEVTACMYFRTPNTQTVAYYEREMHMRPISHHIFLWLAPNDEAPPPDRMNEWGECYGDQTNLGVLGGGETPIMKVPASGDYAPENVGFGRALGANMLVRVEMHAFNAGDVPVLREAWANIHYKPKSEVTQWVSDVALYGGLSYATKPHTREVMKTKTTIHGDARWVTIWGHGHSHMKRFSAWLVRGAERTLLIEDYDWQHPATLTFDSLTENPAPDAEMQRAGGYSGVLQVHDGDVVEWECEVDNDSDAVLRYRNSVDGGEMCNLFGEYVGPGGGLAGVYLQGRATQLP